MVTALFKAPFRARFAGLVILAGVLGACSSGDAPGVDEASPSDDPPGAALPLSIGGRAAAVGEGLFETSVNCAAALDITAERLAQMADNANTREMRLLSRAEEHFTQRADEAQQEDDTIIASAPAAIARRRSEKAGDTREQAQLAIACLRRFGDDVGDVQI